MDHEKLLDVLAAARRRAKRDVMVNIIAIVLEIGGLILVGIFGNWLIALGVFFTLWAHNINTGVK